MQLGAESGEPRTHGERGASQRLLDVRSAVRAYLPVSVERLVAARAHVADLGVAHGAHHEILLDGGAALRAAAVLGQLTLAQGHVELLLLAIGEHGAGAQHEIGDQAHERDDGDDAPHPGLLHAATARIDDHIGDREGIERHDAGDERVDDSHELRRHDLLNVLRHTAGPSGPSACAPHRVRYG